MHVKDRPEQGAPSMALDEVVRGLRLALRSALRADGDVALGAGAGAAH